MLPGLYRRPREGAAPARAVVAVTAPGKACRRMERLKKGVAAIRNGTEHVRDVGHRMKEKLATNPVGPGHLGSGIMERIHGGGRQYEIGGRTVEEEKQLSEGGFAFVWTARDVHSDEEFALKKILCQDKASITMARREVEILERLPSHPNLVKYYGHTTEKADGNAKEVVLLFELCPGGHLLDLLELHHGRLTEARILSVFTDVCTAVSVLHARQPPVQHRDLKIENILLGSNGSFKLCDFGSWSDETGNPGDMDKQQISAFTEQIERYTTMMYRPPEFVDFYQRFDISEKVDIWMLGCILFTLMFCRHPFQDETSLAISNARYDLPSEPSYSEKLQDLTHWCLARDPRDRPSIKDICNILADFREGAEITLPAAVVEHKERKRRLYQSSTIDVDVPLKLASGVKKERKSRDVKSGSRHRSIDSKNLSKPKKDRDRNAKVAAWGYSDVQAAFTADEWCGSPKVMPQRCSAWASFDHPEQQSQSSRPPKTKSSPSKHADSWPAWEDRPSEVKRSASVAYPSAPMAGRAIGRHSRSVSMGAEHAWTNGSWPSTSEPSASDDWDPFGNSRGAGTARAELSQSWPSESSWVQPLARKSRQLSDAGGGDAAAAVQDPPPWPPASAAQSAPGSTEGRTPAEQTSPPWPRPGAGFPEHANAGPMERRATASGSMWPFCISNDAYNHPATPSNSQPLYRAKTAPCGSIEDASNWPAQQRVESESSSPSITNGASWPNDGGVAPKSRSPWDPPDGPALQEANGVAPTAEIPAFPSQAAWPSGEDPFEWLTRSSPLPGSKAMQLYHVSNE